MPAALHCDCSIGHCKHCVTTAAFSCYCSIQLLPQHQVIKQPKSIISITSSLQQQLDLKVQGLIEAAGSWSLRITASPMTAGAGSSSASLVCLSANTSPASTQPCVNQSINLHFLSFRTHQGIYCLPMGSGAYSPDNVQDHAMQSFRLSFIRLFICSVTCWLIHLLIRSIMHSLTHPFIQLSTCAFIHPCTQSSNTYPFLEFNLSSRNSTFL